MLSGVTWKRFLGRRQITAWNHSVSFSTSSPTRPTPSGTATTPTTPPTTHTTPDQVGADKKLRNQRNGITAQVECLDLATVAQSAYLGKPQPFKIDTLRNMRNSTTFSQERLRFHIPVRSRWQQVLGMYSMYNNNDKDVHTNDSRNTSIHVATNQPFGINNYVLRKSSAGENALTPEKNATWLSLEAVVPFQSSLPQVACLSNVEKMLVFLPSSRRLLLTNPFNGHCLVIPFPQPGPKQGRHNSNADNTRGTSRSTISSMIRSQNKRNEYKMCDGFASQGIIAFHTVGATQFHVLRCPNNVAPSPAPAPATANSSMYNASNDSETEAPRQFSNISPLWYTVELLQGQDTDVEIMELHHVGEEEFLIKTRQAQGSESQDDDGFLLVSETFSSAGPTIQRISGDLQHNSDVDSSSENFETGKNIRAGTSAQYFPGYFAVGDNERRTAYVEKLAFAKEANENAFHLLSSLRMNSDASMMMSNGNDAASSSTDIQSTLKHNGSYYHSSKRFKTLSVDPSRILHVSEDSRNIELVDWNSQKVCTIRGVDQEADQASMKAVEWNSASFFPSTNELIALQVNRGTGEGTIRIFQTSQGFVERDLATWERIWGLKRTKDEKKDRKNENKKRKNNPRALELTQTSGNQNGKQIGLKISSTKNATGSMGAAHKQQHVPKELRENPLTGKIDEKGLPHVGGNTFHGGVGGSSTAGMGGRGGPYRTWDGVSDPTVQVSDEAKAEVDDETRKKAREMGQALLQERLDEIEMTADEYHEYLKIVDGVRDEIEQLRNVLHAADVNTDEERVWLTNQGYGELDFSKLVDGITGETQIYKRRGEKKPTMAGIQPSKPKKIRFALDCSASMFRFDPLDGRLNRMLELAAMIMESLEGFENKFAYTMVAHSGETEEYGLVDDYFSPPQTMKDRHKVLMKMKAHTQFCLSGDSTLKSTEKMVRHLAQDGDENDGSNNHGYGSTNANGEVEGEGEDHHFAFVISDANFRRYGLSPEQLGEALTAESRVKAYAIFIASLGEEADILTDRLPSGRGFVCLSASDLPHTFQEIFVNKVV